MNLYLVHTDKGDFYVVAEHATLATSKVINTWGKWYPNSEIVVKSIDFLAEETALYPKNGRLLINSNS